MLERWSQGAVVVLAIALAAGCLGAESPSNVSETPQGEGNESLSPTNATAETNGTEATSNGTLADGNRTERDGTAETGATNDTEPADPGPRAVIAFVDVGINPYHASFRWEDPNARQHPSTYLESYPESAQALNLTFDHETLEDAIQADCQAWSDVEPGALYWVPGTRIVGLYVETPMVHSEDRDPSNFGCDGSVPRPYFLESGGHGTMVASRGAGSDYGACPTCLVTAVEGLTPGAVAWTANRSWIDVQSNSWLASARPDVVETIEQAGQRQPSFWAAGNGPAGQGGVGLPDAAKPHHPPSVLRVGGHDNGHVTAWTGSSPHVVADACWSWAAEHDSLNETTPRTGGGTSGAAPFAAGIAAHIVEEARRILGDDTVGVENGTLARGDAAAIESGPLADGDLTQAELERVLLTTADPRPESVESDGDPCEIGSQRSPGRWSLPVGWREVPEGPAGVPLIGYGGVAPYTAQQAVEVLAGNASMPDRPHADAYFSAHGRAKQATHSAATTPS